MILEEDGFLLFTNKGPKRVDLINSWNLKIKTVSEANMFEHWTSKYKRHKNQKVRIKLKWLEADKKILTLPIHIELIRIATRSLDEKDNLPMSFKYISDALAECFVPGLAIGRADDSKLITWSFKQEKGKPQAIKVNFYKEVT